MVLIPLAAWMFFRVPSEGVAVAKNSSTGQDIFLQNCALCHVHGLASAPRAGVRGDWEPRLMQGREQLLKSVLKGKGGMPPKGGNASISDAQAEAALDYMLNGLAGPDEIAKIGQNQTILKGR